MIGAVGKNPSIYQHNLVALVDKNPHRFHMPSRFGEKLQRIPDKLVPRKFALSHKVPDTKGCTKCCVGKSRCYVRCIDISKEKTAFRYFYQSILLDEYYMFVFYCCYQV